MNGGVSNAALFSVAVPHLYPVVWPRFDNLFSGGNALIDLAGRSQFVPDSDFTFRSGQVIR